MTCPKCGSYNPPETLRTEVIPSHGLRINLRDTHVCACGHTYTTEQSVDVWSFRPQRIYPISQ